MVAAFFGHSDTGIRNVLERLHRNYMWATEFENVHTNWDFVEIPIQKNNKTFQTVEHLYQETKPKDEADHSLETTHNRCRVMREAVHLKFTKGQNSDYLLNLLASTYPHALVSIKPDPLWGIQVDGIGQNKLGMILEKLREEVIVQMSKQLRNEYIVDCIWKCYLPRYLPPEWVRTDFGKYLGYGPRTSINNALLPQYFTTSDQTEILDLVIRNRVPTNMFNEDRFDRSKMQKYFSYSESGYTTAFRDAENKKLPPNFALLCSATVKNDQVDKYMESVHKSRKCVIRVINSIGFAFDDASQPDYNYFIKNNRLHTFQRHLENMFRCIFAAYNVSKTSILVLSEVGVGGFCSLFPGDSMNYLNNYFYPALALVYSKLSNKTTVILVMGDPSDMSIELLQQACPVSRVQKCGCFPHIVTQYVQHLEEGNTLAVLDFDTIDAEPLICMRHYISNALFVNAWDPHSLVGNGNKGDDSLDGFIGRNTNMALV